MLEGALSTKRERYKDDLTGFTGIMFKFKSEVSLD